MPHSTPRLVLDPDIPAEQVFANAIADADGIGLRKRSLAFHLELIKRKSLTDRTPYADVQQYAELVLGINRRPCGEYVRVGTELLSLTLLDEAFLDGRIQWSSLRRLVTVVLVGTQKEWIEFAERNNCRTVSETVSRCRPGQLPHEASEFALRKRKRRVPHNLTDEVSDKYEIARIMASQEKQRLLKDDELLEELVEKYVGDNKAARLLPMKLPHAERNHDGLPHELRAEIKNRDKHECRNCGSHYNLHVHHIVYRENGGDNSRSNLILVCSRCHTTLHAGYLVITGNPEQKVTFVDRHGNPLGRIGWDPSTIRAPLPHGWQSR